MSKPLTIARLPPPSCCFHSIEPPAKQVKSDPDAPETTATEPAAEPATEGTTEQTSKETETPPEDDKTATEPPASAPGLPPGVPPLNGSTDTPAATTPGDNEDDPTIEEKAEVSALYVGRVIGKGGEMIRDLQARSGCRMDVDQNVPAGSPRIITYRGTRKTVDFAKEMVAMLCTPNGNEAQLPLGEASREQVQVPSTSVGKIIGRGGEMIRELQSKSQAKIQVDHAVGPSDTRTVTITGTPPSVIKAKEMVEFLVANPMMDAMAAIQMLLQDKLHRGGQWGSGPPYPNMPNQGQGMTGGGMFGGGGGGGGGYGQNSYGPPQNQQYGYQQQAPPQQYGGQQQPSNYYGGGGGGGAPGGGGETEVFFAAKMYMGRIIGQKGVTVNDLQKRSGCDIQINQDVPPGQDCEITLRGTRAGIESAKKMLNDVIQMGPAHPYAGGGGREYFGWILSLTLCLSLFVSASPTHSLTNTRFSSFKFYQQNIKAPDRVATASSKHTEAGAAVDTVPPVAGPCMANSSKCTGSNSTDSNSRPTGCSSSNSNSTKPRLQQHRLSTAVLKLALLSLLRGRPQLPPTGRCTTTTKRPERHDGTSLPACLNSNERKLELVLLLSSSLLLLWGRRRTKEREREKQWLGEEKQEEGDELEKQRGIDNGTTWGKWFFVIVLSG